MKGLVNQGKPEQSKTVTPDASGQTVTPDAGKTLSSVVINGDSDLVATNIKSGVNIFGVTGNMTSAQCATGVKAATNNEYMSFTCGFQPTAYVIGANTWYGNTTAVTSCYPDNVTASHAGPNYNLYASGTAKVSATGGTGTSAYGSWYVSVRWVAMRT